MQFILLSLLFFSSFSQAVLVFLFWQNLAFVLHQIWYKFQLTQHRHWQVLWKAQKISREKRITSTAWKLLILQNIYQVSMMRFTPTYTDLYCTKEERKQEKKKTNRFYDIPILGNCLTGQSREHKRAVLQVFWPLDR